MNIGNEERVFAQELIDFIYESPTPFHCASVCSRLLLESGFEKLELSGKWDLKEGGRYFVEKNSSAIIAFCINSADIEKNGFRIIASHSDSPAIKLKPSPEMSEQGAYYRLNTEIYGGPILNTWLDRPLGMAGRVTLKSDSPLRPKEALVDFKRPIAVIPNLAIHMNRDVNKGVELNRQTELAALLAVLEGQLPEAHKIKALLSGELAAQPEDILDFELSLYEYEKGCITGLEGEFISSSRLDNLSMVHAGIRALLDSKGSKGVSVKVVFDNEEVGSSTKQGADSPMLRNVLERIAISLSKGREDFIRATYSSFLISSDLAHALHPNRPEKSDSTNRPIINKGPVIKASANQKYTSDSHSAGVYEQICNAAEVEFQRFANRSDEPGGSTIGPISASQLDIPSVDVGSPVLAMHSIRELGGVKDHHMIYKSFVKFFEIE
ncbi:M18 family aminopeptidase 2 [Peptoclostridium acidaminophilum DSM 3953]|uniref:M18 family aminopeptidase n=1 Tax=Peptoclostridium acidaminophilum DSM 3953 TaxID=1286171 RepID=W8TL53_PEPAC|nr:M18 family aminopeptidase [Peptoclostridium acidaminophilum]AHM56937.1 M18 family aminopeptidase 2 [Peptoclostridium acidaminophilum DSM 3953]